MGAPQPVPPGWEGRLDVIARALRAGCYTGERHALSLALAGVLCEHVAPEAVPAIVASAASRAGWDGEHHRRNASDTVRRWAAGRPVRQDLPPAVRAAVDEALGVLPVHEQSLADATRRLEAALRDASDGLTVVKAPCGLGKTHAARRVAAERAQRGSDGAQAARRGADGAQAARRGADGAQAARARRNTRTSISVPTNALAEQVTADLRAAGVPTLRVFSPLAARDTAGATVCQYAETGRHLAAGGLSVRRELCHGCDVRESCSAVDGADGPSDARVVVGNHGLLAELDATAGVTGLLVIDEPQPPHEDVVLRREDLAETQARLGLFEPRYAAAMAPALAAALGWLDRAPLAEPASLTAALELAPPELCEAAFEAVGALDALEAVGLALESGQRTPPVLRLEIQASRGAVSHARRIGEACRVLGALYWAFTDESVRAAVYEQHGTGARVLALTGPRRELVAALRRDGRVVLTAADADVYLDTYRAVVGYEPRYVALGAPDGCAVRRVVVRTRRATRAEWLARGRRPAGSLRAALACCTGRVAVVTFKALEGWVRGELAQLGLADAEVGHYGALRGLDGWKDFDALITLGDPWPNLDHAERAGTDARAQAAAELEQAHGRLRVVHRTRPATQVHVGDVLPAGWRPPIEEVQSHDGRPPNVAGDAEALREAVKALGGVRAAAAAVGVGHSAMGRYVSGERACPPKVVAASVSAAAARAASERPIQGVPETSSKEVLTRRFGDSNDPVGLTHVVGCQ